MNLAHETQAAFTFPNVNQVPMRAGLTEYDLGILSSESKLATIGLAVKYCIMTIYLKHNVLLLEIFYELNVG